MGWVQMGLTYKGGQDDLEEVVKNIKDLELVVDVQVQDYEEE